MNPFMMYCAAVRPLIKQKFGRLTSQAISKHAAEMWRLEPESVRDGFREMSRIAHERHAELNPDFVWMPSYGGRVNLAARSVSETRKNNRKLACRVGKKTDPLHSDVSVAAVPLMPLLAGQSALQQMASSPSMLPAAPTLASLDALVAASSSAAPAFVAEPETFDPLLEVWNRDEPHVSAHRHSWKSFESLDQSNVSHPAFGQAFHALGNAQTMPAMPRSLPETDHFAPLLNALSGQSTPSLTASSFGSSTGSLSFYGSPSGVSYMPAVSAPQPIIAASYSMGASSFASLADPQIGNYPGATSEPIVAAPTNAKQDSPVHLNSDKMLAALFQSDFKIGTVATAAQPGSSSALIDKAFAKMTPMRAPADVGLPMKTSGYDQHHAVSHSGIDGSKLSDGTFNLCHRHGPASRY
nr:hypothetical protein HK105_001918 [Polyrhizophydium stewartii]